MFLFVVCVNMLLLASNLNKQVLELLINLYIPNVLGGVLMKFLCYLSKYKYIYIYISLSINWYQRSRLILVWFLKIFLYDFAIYSL